MSCRTEPFGTFEICVLAILLPWEQTEVAQEQTRSDWRALAVVGEYEAAVVERVLELLHELLLDVHLQVSDIPFVARPLRDVVGELQSELHPALMSQRVGEIRGVGRLEIVVSVVAEESRQTAALRIEGCHIERLARTYQRLVAGGEYQTVCHGGEVGIFHGVDERQLVHRHLI